MFSGIPQWAEDNFKRWFPSYEHPASSDLIIEPYLEKHYRTVAYENNFRILRRNEFPSVAPRPQPDGFGSRSAIPNETHLRFEQLFTTFQHFEPLYLHNAIVAGGSFNEHLRDCGVRRATNTLRGPAAMRLSQPDAWASHAISKSLHREAGESIDLT